MGRTATVVDVQTIRVCVDRDDPRTGGGVDRGGDERRRSVRAVDHDRQAVESTGKRGAHVTDVAVGGVRCRVHTADTCTGGCRYRVTAARDALFDPHLHLVVQLVAACSEDLDPVVRHGIVRGRDHDTQAGAVFGRQECDCRGRQNTDVHDIDAGCGEPSRDSGRQHLPTRAWIAADNSYRPSIARGRNQHRCRGSGDFQRQFRRQQPVGQTPNTVGTEQSSHADPSPLSPEQNKESIVRNAARAGTGYCIGACPRG